MSTTSSETEFVLFESKLEPNASQAIAKHVMGIHMNRGNDNANEAVGEIDIDKMKKYIAYCKR